MKRLGKLGEILTTNLGDLTIFLLLTCVADAILVDRPTFWDSIVFTFSVYFPLYLLVTLIVRGQSTLSETDIANMQHAQPAAVSAPTQISAAEPVETRVITDAVTGDQWREKVYHVKVSGTSCGRYMDRDIPEWIETGDGKRRYFEGTIGKNKDGSWVGSGIRDGMHIIEPGLVYKERPVDVSTGKG